MRGIACGRKETGHGEGCVISNKTWTADDLDRRVLSPERAGNDGDEHGVFPLDLTESVHDTAAAEDYVLRFPPFDTDAPSWVQQDRATCEPKTAGFVTSRRRLSFTRASRRPVHRTAHLQHDAIVGLLGTHGDRWSNYQNCCEDWDCIIGEHCR